MNFPAKPSRPWKPKTIKKTWKKHQYIIYLYINISYIYICHFCPPPFLQKMRRTWNQDAEVSSCRWEKGRKRGRKKHGINRARHPVWPQKLCHGQRGLSGGDSPPRVGCCQFGLGDLWSKSRFAWAVALGAGANPTGHSTCWPRAKVTTVWYV